ncbi:MAG: M36 family metallopeptidase [Cryomorphaceae bacterium]|nr:M36 family metallopeptidase [Cryomorphaceae bacterium]
MKHFLFFVCVTSIAFLNAQTVELPSEGQMTSEIQKKLSDNEKQDWDDVRLLSAHKDHRDPIFYAYWQQFFQNKPIYNAIATTVFDGNGSLRYRTDAFASGLSEMPGNRGFTKSYSSVLNAAEEIVSWGEHSMRIENVEYRGDTVELRMTGAFNIDFPVEIYPVFVKTDNGRLESAWNVSLPPTSTADWWQIRLCDKDLRELERNNWTVTCTHHHDGDEPHYNWQHLLPDTENNGYQTETDSTAADSSGYFVFRFPVESPSHGGQSMAIEPWDSLASPAGWHSFNVTNPAMFTITRGNNVYAYEDMNANNSPGYSPDGGVNLSFIHPFNPNLSIVPNQDINITQLFYANNKAHDLFYHVGFTEDAGNFQFRNFGRGGQQNDNVIAEAMDGGGTNNANFLTPPDGFSGRMQMYPWTQFSNTELLTVHFPASLAGGYTAVNAVFAPDAADSLAIGEIVLMNDSSSNPTRGCVQTSQDLSGKIVFIDRGGCTFGEKAYSAQNAGAIGVIIANNVPGAPFAMAGTPPGPIHIPVVMISQATGNFIRQAFVNDSVHGEISDTIGSLFFDSSLDNGVVLHEYGHGVSIRLTGGASQSGCLSNEEQAGEGWSDFFGLAYLTEANQQAEDRRGIGTFLIGQSTTGRGIRVQPYSTSFAQNNLTYNNIRTLSIPHGVGTVWAAMIWDLYWALVDEYGFNPNMYEPTGGNNIAMQLVMDGLKYQVCSPGFVDSRDAILMADSIRYNGDNQCLIWEVFARRGLGFSADQGSSASRADGTQAFDEPDFCEFISTRTFDEEGIYPKAYPNPTDGIVHIDFALWEGHMQIDVTGLDGRVVKHWEERVLPNSRADLDLRDLPAGMYILTIRAENGKTQQEKIVIR